MAKRVDPGPMGMMVQKMRGLSEEVDYVQMIANPFEITGPLGTFQQEAEAKGWVVVVTIGFMTLSQWNEIVSSGQGDLDDE